MAMNVEQINNPNTLQEIVLKSIVRNREVENIYLLPRSLQRDVDRAVERYGHGEYDEKVLRYIGFRKSPTDSDRCKRNYINKENILTSKAFRLYKSLPRGRGYYEILNRQVDYIPHKQKLVCDEVDYLEIWKVPGSGAKNISKFFDRCISDFRDYGNDFDIVGCFDARFRHSSSSSCTKIMHFSTSIMPATSNSVNEIKTSLLRRVRYAELEGNILVGINSLVIYFRYNHQQYDLTRLVIGGDPPVYL